MATIYKYFKPLMFLLRIIGFWPGPRLAKNFDLYFFVVNVAIMGTFNLSMFLFLLVASLDDLEVLAKSLHVFLVCIMATIKAYYYRKHWALFDDLLVRLEEDDFQPKNERQRNIVYDNMKVHVGVQIYFLCMYVVLMFLWLSGPVLFTKQKRLPFNCWYPYDENDYFLFTLSYIHQSVGMCYIALTNVLLDLTTSGLIAYNGAQCDLLSDSLRNMYGYTKEKLGKEGRGGVLEAMDGSLVECFKYHRKILRFNRDINRISNTYIFILFATSLLSICMTMFEMSVQSPASLDFLSTSFYEAAEFTELLIYCFFGDVLIEKSDRLAYALYEADWIECSQKFRRNMAFFILRTNRRPMKIYGVNFFVLSLPSFTQILRTSWSFFAMLHQVHNRDVALKGS